MDRSLPLGNAISLTTFDFHCLSLYDLWDPKAHTTLDFLLGGKPKVGGVMDQLFQKIIDFNRFQPKM